MSRTRRSVPHHANNDFIPTYHNPRGQTSKVRYERGHVRHEVFTDFRQGHWDTYETTSTGTKNTHRVKQVAGKRRRQHHKNEAREEILDS